MKRIASSRLSVDTQVCMDAQTEVKQFVKDCYMRGQSWKQIQKRLLKLIDGYVEELEQETLKEQARKSLYSLAWRVYRTMEQSSSFGNLAVLLAVLALSNGTATTLSARTKAVRIVMTAPPSLFGLTTSTTSYADRYFSYKAPYGTAVQQRVAYYMRDVTETVRRLTQEKALDESDPLIVRKRNSLRAHAELEVRYQGHIREIHDLRESGYKLVICSSHADCSNRCYSFQGRVYSLDGTYGTTDDGRKYEPLENATNPPDPKYYTKRGVANALLGYNCRHRLVPYAPGRKPPYVSREQQQREKTIDERQRRYERAIINARENAIMYKDVDNKKYVSAKKAATKLMAEYIKYSHDHGRAYYTSRVRIL